MHTQNLFVNDGGNGKTIEAVGENFPQFDVVASFAYSWKSGGQE
jgi:hypothetical protein